MAKLVSILDQNSAESVTFEWFSIIKYTGFRVAAYAQTTQSKVDQFEYTSGNKVVNSLSAMNGHDHPLLNQLRSTVVSSKFLFVHGVQQRIERATTSACKLLRAIFTKLAALMTRVEGQNRIFFVLVNIPQFVHCVGKQILVRQVFVSRRILCAIPTQNLSTQLRVFLPPERTQQLSCQGLRCKLLEILR